MDFTRYLWMKFSERRFLDKPFYFENMQTPNNIMWENRCATETEKFIRKCQAFFVYLCVMVACFSMLFVTQVKVDMQHLMYPDVDCSTLDYGSK